MCISAPNADTTTQDAIRAVIGVGAPWYTSGFSSGTAQPDLEQQAEAEQRHPGQQQRLVGGVGRDRRDDGGQLHRAANPYSRAMPNRRNAEEKAPSRKYFTAASWTAAGGGGQPAQQVERQRQHLERHEQREQVVGRGNSSMPPIANRVSGKISCA